ncbi:MAG TPA: phage holin family protein [Candidatus Pullichristensenella excrementigallinarum]|uniref:Phage holin family protein n=1 Tax=Candidatus Pullichristensenella excrementigallinarum TaxID=2840907 RepID=A0A9D1IBI2_9FIRM|nr:phage holin family protein [Candidatus Pullichristensenella excrementigallinarum]
MSRTTRYWFVFLCCVLAIPTCVYGLGILWAHEPFDALLAGALLGLAHVILRPVLRLATKPIGCLTFGLSSFAIDVGLIYACAYALDGFAVTSLAHALFAAILVNAACLIVGGRH